MSVEINKALARRWMKEIWQKANPAAIDELLAPDIFFNYTRPGVKPNREAYKQEVNSYLIGFPDLQYTIEDIIAEGNKVAVRYVGRGTHKGEFWGIAPTGKKVTMRGISIIRIEGGKIVEEWVYNDYMGLTYQFGVMPLAVGGFE